MSFVYFIKPVGQPGPVKIGVTKNVAKRFEAICAASPLPLEVLLIVDGDRLIEAKFHQMFIDSHSHREWFHWSDEMGRVLEAIRAGAFHEEMLPAKGATLGKKPDRSYFTPEWRAKRSADARTQAAWRRQRKLDAAA